MKKTAVIGAGLSGLTVAYLLKKSGFDVTVFEKSDRVGGCLHTVQVPLRDRDGSFALELGPNGWLDNAPKTLELIRDLGLEGEVIYSRDQASLRFLFLNGKMVEVPTNPILFLSSKLFRWYQKIFILLKLVQMKFWPKPFSSHADSIYSTFKKLFGTRVADLVRIAMLGIFAGDAKNLSFARCFSKLDRRLQITGSLLKPAPGEPFTSRPRLYSLKNGVSQLTEHLAKKLNVKLQTSVTRALYMNAKWSLTVRDEIEGSQHTSELVFDQVICASSLSQLLNIFSSSFSTQDREKIEALSPVVSVSFLLSRPLKFSGFGILVSPEEKMKTLGILHPPDIFENRAPAENDVITLMLGGTFNPEVVKKPDDEIFEVAKKEAAHILNEKFKIESQWIHRHIPGIPQYEVGENISLLELEKEIAVTPKFFYISNSLGGVSMNDCIQKAYETADKISVSVLEESK